jgi:hypothetical protein
VLLLLSLLLAAAPRLHEDYAAALADARAQGAPILVEVWVPW